MNVKKGSKNAIENRGKTLIVLCKICGIAKKIICVKSQQINKIAYMCNCGIIDKQGNIISQ
jgi:hypothetical protein